MDLNCCQNIIIIVFLVIFRPLCFKSAFNDQNFVLHQSLSHPLHVYNLQKDWRNQPEGFQEPVRQARLLQVPLQNRWPGIRHGQGRGINIYRWFLIRSCVNLRLGSQMTRLVENWRAISLFIWCNNFLLNLLSKIISNLDSNKPSSSLNKPLNGSEPSGKIFFSKC